MHSLFRRSAPAAGVLALSALSALFVAVRPNAARAQSLLVDPTGGTNIVFPHSSDDDVVPLDLGFNFSFFGGTPTTTAYAATNGNLNFVNDSFPGSNYIAPLYTDLVIFPGSVSSTGAPGQYLAVTYDQIAMYGYSSQGGYNTFQAVLFGATTTIGGFDFQPGDIAFSYAGFETPFSNATVGLTDAGGSQIANAATQSTTVSSSSLSALPIYGQNQQFLLFRPDGAGSYAASLETAAGSSVAAPEPGSLALGLGGVLPLMGALAARRRRRRRAA